MILLSVVPQLTVTLLVEVQCAYFRWKFDVERDLLLGEALKRASRWSIVPTARVSVSFLPFRRGELKKVGELQCVGVSYATSRNRVEVGSAENV